jgi:pimeloyl-ACP methyl ester carboxylesterase
VGVQRLHLLGQSWGGVLALRYAAAYPEHLQSLILVGSGVLTPEAVQQGQASKAQRVAALQEQGVLRQDIRSMAEILLAYFSDPGLEMPDELKSLSFDPAVEQRTVNRTSRVALALLTVAALVACQPRETAVFSIHLLVDEMPATELSSWHLDDIELQDEAIVCAGDIVSYSRSTHEIELTAEAYSRIQQLFELLVRVSGMPFVVSVGRDRIYAGAFWTPLSSLSFDGVVILQPSDPDQRVIRITLGYPGPQFFTGQDPRSDERILRSVKAAGKLKQ